MKKKACRGEIQKTKNKKQKQKQKQQQKQKKKKKKKQKSEPKPHQMETQHPDGAVFSHELLEGYFAQLKTAASLAPSPTEGQKILKQALYPDDGIDVLDAVMRMGAGVTEISSTCQHAVSLGYPHHNKILIIFIAIKSPEGLEWALGLSQISVYTPHPGG